MACCRRHHILHRAQSRPRRQQETEFVLVVGITPVLVVLSNRALKVICCLENLNYLCTLALKRWHVAVGTTTLSMFNPVPAYTSNLGSLALSGPTTAFLHPLQRTTVVYLRPAS